MRRKEPWPNIAQIIDAGGQLHVVTHDYGTCISSLESDGQMVCMTQTNGENFTTWVGTINLNPESVRCFWGESGGGLYPVGLFGGFLNRENHQTVKRRNSFRLFGKFFGGMERETPNSQEEE